METNHSGPEESKPSEKHFTLWGGNGKENIVTDNSAPQLYSHRIITTFSALFSVLFGSILFAMNTNRTGNRKGGIVAIAFGVIYTALQIAIISIIAPNTSGLTIVFNFLGASVLTGFFWNKYIGVDAKYRTRPWIIPLIIGLLISALFIAMFIIGQQHK